MMSSMKIRVALLVLSCSLTALSGTASKPSPERQLLFVAHRSDFVGGNFAVNRQENYRLNLPTFSEIYNRGKQDRRAASAKAMPDVTPMPLNNRP
jgi:hypothetical protein